MRVVKVTEVHPESLGAELGLEPGSELLSINGRELHDFLDWEFLSAEEAFELDVRQPDGERITFEIERALDDPFGLSLEPPRVRRCANRCDFCFVDGLPQGLRPGLYVRDDDYRLSFRFGHFVTMTNLKDWDIDRIIEYRLSPLYVSVHATDPVTRRLVLRNPLAQDILPLLRRFAGHGIVFHTQIVMSPGVNDGAVMEQTLSDLYALGDVVLNCSVVPVGLTEHSKHHLVREPTADECRAAVATVERWEARAQAERGSTWAFGADELYNRAGLSLPPESAYGTFEQVENGVGAVRFLQRQVREDREQFRAWDGLRIGVVTGTAMGALMPPVLDDIASASGASVELIVVENTLFGPSVTTAGLLPGRAIQAALASRTDFDLVLIPGEAVNDNGLFMDDMPFLELSTGQRAELRLSKRFSDALPQSCAA
jgi:putative radical SAM enzyme (TIGR03279 family)